MGDGARKRSQTMHSGKETTRKLPGSSSSQVAIGEIGKCNVVVAMINEIEMNLDLIALVDISQ